MNEIKLGKHKHFKGNYYEVIGFAKHSETLVDMIIYRALYGNGGTWVRPASMLNEIANVDGKTVRRFEFVGESAAEEINIVFENEKIKVEEIISNGAESPAGFWYDNPINEWVRVTAGEAVLEFADREMALKTGDNYCIKAYEKHRIKYTSADCKWLCVHVK